MKSIISTRLFPFFLIGAAATLPGWGRQLDFQYRNIGPSRGGRVTAVAGVPSRPSTFYMGATGGGVWKTTDYGRNWNNVSDGFFQTGSIGAIRVASSDPNLIYVGTGSDGIRSNVITGRGVYKSTDAGKTWKFLGLRDVGQIGAVLIHPENPKIVYVAAIGHAFGPSRERGVYRSTDGGSSWEKCLYVSPETGAVDLEFAPDDPDQIYASVWHGRRKPWTIISGNEEGGVYRSDDAGDHWRRLAGLPTGIVGKSDLAVSAADPDRLYVLIEAAEKPGVYRSDDRGETFQLVSDQASLLDRPFYYTNIDADPNDADVVYVNSTGFFQSTDGGKTWRRRSTPHGDNHDMWINPNDSKLFIQSNDGGANVTRDGGETWSTQDNQPTAELYQVHVDDQFPYWVYAGQQDNSTIRVPSLPPFSPSSGAAAFWQSVGGCETGPAVPKPGDPDIVYSNCKGRFGRYNHRTGQEQQYYVGAANMYGHNPRDLEYRFQRVSPIHVSPHDPDVIYHASQYLHRSTDEGVTWETISPDLTAFTPETQVISGSPITRDITGEEFYSTIYAVQESPLRKGLIWVGANDGPVHVTPDGGEHWHEVTPADLPPGGRVQTVEASPHRPEKAYIAVYRYLLGDWEPYIYKTEDYGRSWVRLTTGNNGLPSDYPTRVVREDPDREGLLYAGTEFGMFVSFDDGVTWETFQHNLPVTPVTDIKVFRKDLVLSTMGRSFWILDNISPLHEFSSEIAEGDDPYCFTPRPAYRMRYRGGRGPNGPEYGQPGADIDYFLPADVEAEIRLQVVDPQGKVVRSFTSEAAREREQRPQQGMRRPRFSRRQRVNLQKTAGFHRFVWDLTHEAQRGSGPMVVPGTYRLRLSVGDWSSTQTLVVRIDPRVAADGVTRQDLVAQEQLSLDVLEALQKARNAAREVAEARAKLADGSSQAGALEELGRRLNTAEGRYQTPMLIDQLSYLYSMLNRADQKPGIDAYRRYEALASELDDILLKLKTAAGSVTSG